MTNELEEMREWVNKKIEKGNALSIAVSDNFGIQLSEKQLSYLNGRLDQLHEMDAVILEFMEERDKKEHDNRNI